MYIQCHQLTVKLCPIAVPPVLQHICAVCSVQCAVCSAVCSVHCAMFSVKCFLFTVKSAAVCSVLYSTFSALLTVCQTWIMWFPAGSGGNA